MPRLIFEFMCPAGHVSEALVESDVRARDCDVCGKQATRIVSAVRSALDPISGHFPGATMTWERTRGQQMAKEQKSVREHGTYLPGQKGKPKIV